MENSTPRNNSLPRLTTLLMPLKNFSLIAPRGATQKSSLMGLRGPFQKFDILSAANVTMQMYVNR